MVVGTILSKPFNNNIGKKVGEAISGDNESVLGPQIASPLTLNSQLVQAVITQVRTSVNMTSKTARRTYTSSVLNL